MSNLKEFLTKGHLDIFRLGLSREEVVALYGPPPNWQGNNEAAGPIIVRPEDSPLWFYFDESIGLGFTRSLKVGAIFVHVPLLKIDCPLLAGWPPITTWSMADLVRWIERNDIKIEPTDWDDVDAKILVGDKCVVSPIFESALLDIKTIEEKRIGTIKVIESTAGKRLKSIGWMSAVEMVDPLKGSCLDS
jgi:hypothetical protein